MNPIRAFAALAVATIMGAAMIALIDGPAPLPASSALPTPPVVLTTSDPVSPNPAVLASLYTLRVSNDEGRTASAIAVARVADQVLVLTARHVTRGLGEAVGVESIAGVRFERTSRVVECSHADAALFWMLDPSRILGAMGQPPALRASVQVGDACYAAGYPLGLGLLITTGFVGGPGFKDMTLMSASVAFGMSGGPVFDSEGRLVGIVSALASMGGSYLPNVALMTPVASFRDWLGEAAAESFVTR